LGGKIIIFVHQSSDLHNHSKHNSMEGFMSIVSQLPHIYSLTHTLK